MTVQNGTAPTLQFAGVSTQTYGAAPFAVSATSNSAGAITYSVVSGPATVSGSTVTLTGAGTVTLQASQAAAGNYTAGTAQTSFTVNPGSPALAFVSVPSQTFGAAPFAVSTTTKSGGSIAYSVVSGPATVLGNQVTLTGVGSVTLQASQAAAGNYTAATATTTFTVAAGTATLTFAAIPAQTFGAAPFTVSATSASSGAVTYSIGYQRSSDHQRKHCHSYRRGIGHAASDTGTGWQLHSRDGYHYVHCGFGSGDADFCGHSSPDVWSRTVHRERDVCLVRSGDVFRGQRPGDHQRQHGHPYRRGIGHAASYTGSGG